MSKIIVDVCVDIDKFYCDDQQQQPPPRKQDFVSYAIFGFC